MLEIKSAVGPVASPGPTPPAAATPQPAEKTVALPEIRKADVKLPAKADIKVDREASMRQLQDAIAQLNERLNDGGRGLAFRQEPSLELPIVTVTNQQTGEVIRQLPSQIVVNMARNIDMARGMIFNNKA